MTEILFAEGLLKILISTETFAMGVNTPARTVVFAALNKFDGENYRLIRSGEYIQMSGRAGRRGVDAQGVVISMMDSPIPEEDFRKMISGPPSPLTSAFHLSYNMLLNMTRMEGVDPEFLLSHSLLQFQNGRKQPEIQKVFQMVEAKLDSLNQSQQRITNLQQHQQQVMEMEQILNEYLHLKNRLDAQEASLRRLIYAPVYVTPFLMPGRLIQVQEGRRRYWGVLLGYRKKRRSTLDKRATISIDGSGLELWCQVYIPNLQDLQGSSSITFPSPIDHSKAQPSPTPGKISEVCLADEVLCISSIKIIVKHKGSSPSEMHQKVNNM